jgi:hypothetical protein
LYARREVFKFQDSGGKLEGRELLPRIPSGFGQLGKNIVECRNAYQFSKDNNDYALNSSIFFKVGILLTSGRYT